jgi:hypothetical protein
MPDTSPQRSDRVAKGAAELDLGEEAVSRLRSRLPAVAEDTVRAIIVEVPGYANALVGPMGTNIADAVQLALGGFLSLASRPRGSDPGTPLAPALEGAYALGRGEARSGRSMDALLAAYRVGARESWRELSRTAVQAGLSAETISQFAELVFAYIDELSAASVAGHSDELATTGRVRDRYLNALALGLLRGDPAAQVRRRADRANWEPPRTLTAVLLPGTHVSRAHAALDQRTLRVEEDLPGLEDDETAVLLVPDVDGASRPVLLRTLRHHHATVGPAAPWMQVRRSYLRVLRARELLLPTAEPEPMDTEQHLAALVLTADPDALADLRARVLEPLAGLRASTRDRLAETLRAWLLHQGHRDQVAASLHVHPQTVRYRMGQLREAFGDRLKDPVTILELTIALGGDADPVGRHESDG